VNITWVQVLELYNIVTRCTKFSYIYNSCTRTTTTTTTITTIQLVFWLLCSTELHVVLILVNYETQKTPKKLMSHFKR